MGYDCEQGDPQQYQIFMAADAKKGRIKVSCRCGAALMAPKKAVGKRVRCPRCSKVLTVPDPGSSADHMLYALADEEYNNPAVEEPLPPPEAQVTEQGTKICPRCSGELSKDAVFCVKCGYHLGRGVVAVTSPAPGQKTKFNGPSWLSSMLKEGWETEAMTNVMGVLGAGLGAAVGGIIYYVFMVSTGYQIGYLAILVGVLAGYGALILGRETSWPGAICAAVFSFLAIALGEYGAYQKFSSEFASFHDYLLGDTVAFLLTLLFMALGIGYGFKVGAGLGNAEE